MKVHAGVLDSINSVKVVVPDKGRINPEYVRIEASESVTVTVTPSYVSVSVYVNGQWRPTSINFADLKQQGGHSTTVIKEAR